MSAHPAFLPACPTLPALPARSYFALCASWHVPEEADLVVMEASCAVHYRTVPLKLGAVPLLPRSAALPRPYRLQCNAALPQAALLCH